MRRDYEWGTAASLVIQSGGSNVATCCTVALPGLVILQDGFTLLVAFEYTIWLSPTEDVSLSYNFRPGFFVRTRTQSWRAKAGWTHV